MKHDALTEAISMLDDGLIAEAREPFKKRNYASVIGFCSAAAVCAAAVGAVLFLPRGGGAEILIMGQNPAEKAVALSLESESDAQVSAIRAFAFDCTDIPVSVISSKPTVITVSGGDLYVLDGTEKEPVSSPFELDGDGSLVWSVPLWDAGSQFQLSAQTGKECRILLLSFDEDLQEWTITENPES